MTRKIFGLFLILFAFWPAIGFAQYNTGEQKVEASLIAEVETIQPGQSFYVAVQQDITPNWHTYWKNPGDSGLATTIKWDLPNGAKAGEIIWPTPERHVTGELTNYGYSDQVLLLTKITPPKTLLPGSILTLKAKVDWLACEEICIPESASVSLSIPVTDQAGGLSQSAAKFEKARQQIPQETDAKTKLDVHEMDMTLIVNPVQALTKGQITQAYFYNDDGLTVPHSAPQSFEIKEGALHLSLKIGDRFLKTGETLSGVLALKTDQGNISYNVKAVAEKATTPLIEETKPTILNDTGIVPATGEQGTTTLWTALFFAFIGGLALNLMPCVFPVLSMKALSLIKHAHHEDQREIRLGGVMYLIGVLVTFTALAVFIIALRSAGEKIGWGAQLQSPAFVLLTSYILFLIGYALSGALNVGTSLMGVGSKWAQRHGMLGSFFTGVLAVIVATPCTAPLMGVAIFFAFTQPWHVSLLVIQMLGFGLALPYLLLTFYPRLLGFLPKPGVWMESFKQFLAFPMFGAAIWLVWVISRQVGSTGVLLSLGGMGFLAFGLWVYGTLANDRKKGLWHILKIIIAVLSIFVALSFTQTIRMLPVQNNMAQLVPSEETALWQKFSPERVAQARADGKPVFVNMTAAWCITCLANERVALNTDKVKEFFQDNQITYFKGDWTNRDPIITKYLKEFGRSGVPLYVYYPPSGEGVVLPQLLTPDSLLSKIKKANL